MLVTLSIHEYVDMIVGLRYKEVLPMMLTYMKLQSWLGLNQKWEQIFLHYFLLKREKYHAASETHLDNMYGIIEKL